MSKALLGGKRQHPFEICVKNTHLMLESDKGPTTRSQSRKIPVMETQSEAPELSGSPSASRTRSKRKADDTIKEETSLLPAHKPKKQRAPRKAKVIPPSAGSGHINYDPNMPVYIGTSGYSYANWKEKYYPKGRAS